MNIARQGYTGQEILNTLLAVTGSRTVKFRYDLLNKTDKKIGELDWVRGCNINYNSFADIKRTASFDIKDNGEIDWLNDRIQPFVLLKMPDGNWVEFSQGIFLLPTPTRRHNGAVITRSIEAYDTSLILVNDMFTKRYTVSTGISYYDAVLQILKGAGISKINIEYTDKTLDRDLEFEIGDAKLTRINELLDAINYVQLHVDENGYFTSYKYVSPAARAPEITYADDSHSIIVPDVEEELDIFNIPNYWVVTASNPESEPLVATYENNNPDSATSTISRGFRKVNYRTIDEIADFYTLNDYVARIAYESSQPYGYVEFKSAIMPVHGYSNILNFKYGGLSISDKYSEVSWSMPLAAGAEMSHRIRRVVSL